MLGARVRVATIAAILAASSIVVGGGDGSAATRGACDGNLKIGISYSDLAQVNQAFENSGAAEQQGANQVPRNEAAEQYNNVLIDALNKEKAFGGCTIEPVYYAFNSVAPDEYVTFTQQECVHFTQDNHVFAIIGGAQETASLAECAKRAKVPLISQGTGQGAVWTKADFKTYKGYLYQPNGMAMDRTASMIDLMFDNGTLEKSSKVAVLASTAPQAETVLKRSYLPALKRNGIKDPLVVKATLDVSQAGPFNLKMKAAGITDVINVPSGAQLVFTLTADALTQEFFPAYYFTSADAPSVAAFAFPKAMEKAKVMSWMSVASADNAEISQNAARKQCDAVYEGTTPPPGGNFGSLPPRPPYLFCDSLNFLAQALRAAPAATTAGFLKGVETLGSVDSASMYGPMTFGPGKYDGATTVRMMTFDAAKKAFFGTGPKIEVPASVG